MNCILLLFEYFRAMAGKDIPDTGGEQKGSDAERTEMMKKMDKDLEEHFAMLEAKAAARGPRTMMVDR